MDDEKRSGTGTVDLTAPRPLADIVSSLSGGYRSMETLVYDILREGIMTGSLAPGEHLRQEKLAKAIGVSRIPVRAALTQLEADGLVKFLPRRGAVVTSLTTKQVTEIYEIREYLETAALRRSSESMTPDRMARLRELATLVDAKEVGMEFVETRRAFSRALYDSAANPQLVDLIEELRLKVGRYLLSWPSSSPHRHTHAEIVELIARGATDEAVEALREHLRSARDGVLRRAQSAKGAGLQRGTAGSLGKITRAGSVD